VSGYIKEQQLTRFKYGLKFFLQIDVSTNAATLAQLLVRVRYILAEDFQEDLMFCLPISERCTGIYPIHGSKLISEKNIFLGQSAAASVKRERQI
jgi:hypothetical protein